ncbi:MAG: nucleoside deaminase [Desulfotalea sp.]
MISKHEYFMDLALLEAKKVLVDGEFPVGCVIVDDANVVATGARHNSTTFNDLDHAEIIAVRNLSKSLKKFDNSQLMVYSTMEPCLMCYATLIVNGFTNIVWAYEDVMGGGTNLDLASLNPLYKDIIMNVIPKVRRTESLTLFKDFFSSPKTEYLKDSLLASYTLKQKI